jgi:hypothetical protein
LPSNIRPRFAGVEQVTIIRYELSMLRFVKEYIGYSLLLVLGAIITVGSRINDAYTIMNAGLPAGVWEAVGLGIFMCTMFVVLARALQSIHSSGKSASSQVSPKHLIKEAYVYGGSSVSGTVPSFQAKMTTNAKDVRIFVDEVHFTPAMAPVFWTARRRLLLKEIQKTSRDEPIFVPLVSRFERDGQKLWRWGDGGPPSDSHFMYFTNATYKARVAVVDQDGNEDHCYFIAHGTETDGGEPLPRVTGEHMFNFPAQWQAEDSKKA